MSRKPARDAIQKEAQKESENKVHQGAVRQLQGAWWSIMRVSKPRKGAGSRGICWNCESQRRSSETTVQKAGGKKAQDTTSNCSKPRTQEVLMAARRDWHVQTQEQQRCRATFLSQSNAGERHWTVLKRHLEFYTQQHISQKWKKKLFKHAKAKRIHHQQTCITKKIKVIQTERKWYQKMSRSTQEMSSTTSDNHMSIFTTLFYLLATTVSLFYLEHVSFESR